jgi:putative transposase
MLFRALKYEYVCLHAWEPGSQAKAGIAHWMTLNNHRRPHSSLRGSLPAVFHQKIINDTQPDQKVQKQA